MRKPRCGAVFNVVGKVLTLAAVLSFVFAGVACLDGTVTLPRPEAVTIDGWSDTYLTTFGGLEARLLVDGASDEDDSDLVATVADVIHRRLTTSGVSHVHTEIKSQGQIIIRALGERAHHPQFLATLIRKHIVALHVLFPDGTADNPVELLQRNEESGRVVEGPESRWFLIEREPLLDESLIEDVRIVEKDDEGKVLIDVRLTVEGQGVLERMVPETLGRSMALLVGGTVVSQTSRVEGISGGRVSLSASVEQAEIAFILDFIGGGPLPTEVTILSSEYTEVP